MAGLVLLRANPHPWVPGKRVYTFATDKSKLGFHAVEVPRSGRDEELALALCLMREWEAAVDK